MSVSGLDPLFNGFVRYNMYARRHHAKPVKAGECASRKSMSNTSPIFSILKNLCKCGRWRESQVPKSYRVVILDNVSCFTRNEMSMRPNLSLEDFCASLANIAKKVHSMF
jgi:hypothetical protein